MGKYSGKLLPKGKKKWRQGPDGRGQRECMYECVYV